MKKEELYEYFEIIKEQYARKYNINIDEFMLEGITLESTGLFNYKGGQSTVYNRLHDNNITNLKELFLAYDLDYGKNELKNNHNYYIHNEIDGIITLLKYKFLGIDSENLEMLLNYRIHMNFNIKISNVHRKYGYPGDVCYSIYGNKLILPQIFNVVDELYKVLKSCGFDQIGTKALIDIAYEQRINDISLGEFISNLSLDIIKTRFAKVPQELKPFLNTLNIIIDFYKNHNKEENKKRC